MESFDCELDDSSSATNDIAPEWHSLHREAQLAAEMLAMGVTTLGKANYWQKGLYSQSFFALSIGFERVAILILVANHYIKNETWMTDEELKKIGHDLSKLFVECEKIAQDYIEKEPRCIKPSLKYI